MQPPPRRATSQPGTIPKFDAERDEEEEEDDDDGWQDMPVVRSEEISTGFEDPDDPRSRQYRPQQHNLPTDEPVSGPSNATGAHLELEADTLLTDTWRQKVAQDESDYTRLRLDEDEESDEVHMRTRYLFDEDKAMTPLSQMQATKELLTEGQRIAYVGLCYLVARAMVRDAGRGWEGQKGDKGKWGAKVKGKGKVEVPVVESTNIWMIKIMARLFQHMELNRDEQRMIESLGEHGVDSSDLVPALTTTHTVKNPEFDPQAKKEAELEEASQIDKSKGVEAARESGHEPEFDIEPPPPYTPANDLPTKDSVEESSPKPTNQSVPPTAASSRPSVKRQKSINPFGDDSDEEEVTTIEQPGRPPLLRGSSRETTASTEKSNTPTRPSALRLPSFHEDDDDDGDIGRSSSPSRPNASPSDLTSSPSRTPSPLPSSTHPADNGPASASVPLSTVHVPSPDGEASTTSTVPEIREPQEEEDTADVEVETDPQDLSKPSGLPSLPGVSTSLTNADELVTLDIRWTVLCDLFLVLIADSVFDARSRVFLCRVAEALGFAWIDVVRFENRITDALEIQEGLNKTEQGEVIEGRRKGALRKRYAMMGAAALGGGLVIGLSAGLLAPVIGAGLGAALGTVGITGTGTFLAGVGGAAMITTGGVLTGANIAGRGMARRTREVRTFELKPLHNNKRVSCFITVGGFMASKMDDVRLPFSTLDPVIGDVLSVLWEPEMMHEMGNALKILTTEILTQVGQQVLQATVMYGLMSALQWPIILTKLGYLIDNPWSNALDRARAAGYILADVIINRHAGVRPISLVGFSLGARVIFYALIELARLKAFGLVQDVFIFGATVTASRQTWLDVRSVVAGRFVNGFATNDWMLGYLFRATSGGLNTVAGLRPVEMAPGLENVDVTEIITGHMSYRSLMPQLLAKVGLPVTAEYFDEPDDPDLDMTVQVRTTEEEEELRKSKKKILGIFPRRATKSKPGSGAATPKGSGEVQRKGSPTKAEKKDKDDDDDLPPREGSDDDLPPREGSDDDLPPREEEGGDMGIPEDQSSREKDAQKEEEAVKSIPKTAGFNFQAISKELGKDIDVDNLKDSSRPVPGEQLNMVPAQPPPPIDRAGSAPPEGSAYAESSPSSASASASLTPTSPVIARSSSYIDAFRNMDGERDDGEGGFEGDITASLTQATGGISLTDLPSWERPLPMGPSPTEPITSPWANPITTARADLPDLPPSPPMSASAKSSLFSFNAWGQSSATSPSPSAQSPSTSVSTTSPFASFASPFAASTAAPQRAAPPARPHPAEFLSPSGGLGRTASGGYTKKEEDLATGSQNPW